MTEKISDKSTSERLIEAAGVLFAQKGFANTTVRDICDAAGANVAAVNYHFGDKEKLHEAVLNYIVEGIKTKFPVNVSLGSDDPPGEKLRNMIRFFLLRRFDPDRPDWQGILLIEQFMTVHPKLVDVIREERAANVDAIRILIKQIAGKDIDDEAVDLCLGSIVGQCLFYILMHAPHAPIPEEEKIEMNHENIEKITDHILNFTLAGIKSKCEK